MSIHAPGTAFHRWVEGEGRDVLVIVHLFGYRIGVPGGGSWYKQINPTFWTVSSIAAFDKSHL